MSNVLSARKRREILIDAAIAIVDHELKEEPAQGQLRLLNAKALKSPRLVRDWTVQVRGPLACMVECSVDRYFRPVEATITITKPAEGEDFGQTEIVTYKNTFSGWTEKDRVFNIE